MKNFKNKIVVITGAGSGIGRALAVAFGNEGAWLALNDVHKASLDETVSVLRGNGVTHILAADFDVSSSEAMQQFADDVNQEWGGAHVIVNNAGIEGAAGPAQHIALDSYRRIMDINFFGMVNGCQAFLPQLMAQSEGAVVNISSIFGLVGMYGYSGYSASKFAVRGYTESLMAEFHNSPISIHCVHPGGIKTNLSQTELSKKQLITPPEDLARYIIQSIKKKRSRIVYGNGAFKVWLGTRMLPQNVMKGLIWQNMKDAYAERMG